MENEQVDYAIRLSRVGTEIPAIGVTKIPSLRKSPFLYTMTIEHDDQGQECATLTPRAYFRSDEDAAAFVDLLKSILNR